jgi:hypothetical protein
MYVCVLLSSHSTGHFPLPIPHSTLPTALQQPTRASSTSEQHEQAFQLFGVQKKSVRSRSWASQSKPEQQLARNYAISATSINTSATLRPVSTVLSSKGRLPWLKLRLHVALPDNSLVNNHPNPNPNSTIANSYSYPCSGNVQAIPMPTILTPCHWSTTFTTFTGQFLHN